MLTVHLEKILARLIDKCGSGRGHYEGGEDWGWVERNNGKGTLEESTHGWNG